MIFLARSWRRQSIRTQIMMLALSIGLPLVALLFWFLVTDLDRLREDGRRQVQVLTQNTASMLNRYFKANEETLSRLARRPLVKALDPQKCDPIFAEYVNLYPEFFTLGLRDREANIVCSFIDEPASGESVRHLPWFEHAISQPGFSVGDGRIGLRSGRWLSVQAMPVLDEMGQVAGVLALPIDLLKLSEVLAQSVPQNAIVSVLDRQRQIVLRSVDIAKFIGRVNSNAQTKMDGQREGFTSEVYLDGVRRLTHIETLPGLEWMVVAGVPEDDLFAEYNARLRLTTAVSFVAFALCATLAWQLGLRVVRPISELARVSSAVADGLQMRASVLGSPEVEHVAQQFNRMLDIRAASEARLRDFTSAGGDWYWECDVDQRYTWIGGAIERQTQRTTTELLGRTRMEVATSYGVHMDQEPWASHLVTLEKHEPFRDFVDFRRTPTGDYWLSASGVPFFDAQGVFAGYRGVTTNITQRVLAELEARQEDERLQAELRASELRFRNLTSLSSDWFWEQDAELKLVRLDGSEGKTTYPVTSSLGGHRWDDLALNMTEADWTAHKALLLARKPFYELELNRTDSEGHPHWFSVSGNPVFNAQGEFSGYVGVGKDITDRKLAQLALQTSLLDKEALLREVHHRVKNNLQVINSLLRLESARSMSSELRRVLADMQGRIRTMALLHELLYRSGTFALVDLGSYLKKLVTEIFRSQIADGARIRLTLDMTSVNVTMDKASTCGLLVNELLSNSLKHGFPGEMAGGVHVALERLSDVLLRLTVSDSGVGLPADFEEIRSVSLGLQLVGDLASQLDGTLTLTPGRGALFSVTFPCGTHMTQTTMA